MPRTIKAMALQFLLQSGFIFDFFTLLLCKASRQHDSPAKPGRMGFIEHEVLWLMTNGR